MVRGATDLDGNRVEIVCANLSAGGAYCRCPTKFAPMTRLDVALELPGTEEIHPRDLLHVSAAVVRCDPDPAGPGLYNLALFFLDPAPEVQDRLAHFIAQHDPAHASGGGHEHRA